MTIRGEDARTRHLATLSDAAADPMGFTLGAGYEFLTRPDAYGALNRAYSIKWTAAPKSMDLGLLYQALEQKQVSMAAANTTDGLLNKLDVTVLKDDKHVFPPYQACIVVRQEALAQYPNLRADPLRTLRQNLRHRNAQNELCRGRPASPRPRRRQRLSAKVC